MAKKVYLVDTENIGSAWIKLLELLTKQDELILFYTEHSPAVSYQDLQRVLAYTDRFEFVHCYAGRNGLDFQLVTYLGYLLRSAGKTDYVVVSNDMGFDTVIRFWVEREKRVTRLTATKINAEYNKFKKSENGETETVPEQKTDLFDEQTPAPTVISVSRAGRGNACGRNMKTKIKDNVPEKTENAESAETEIVLVEQEEKTPVESNSEVKENNVSEELKKGDLPKPRKKTPSKKSVKKPDEEPAEEKKSVVPEKEELKPKKSGRSRSGKAVLTKTKNVKNDTDEGNTQSDMRVDVEENDTPSTFLYRFMCEILPFGEIDWLYGMLCDHPMPENGLNALYNEIIKHFGQEKGLDVYKRLKPNIGHFTELLKY
jgi:hypothetical protein